MPLGISSDELPALIDMTEYDFTTRLESMVNTYYQLSVAPLGYTGNLPDLTDKSWYNITENAYGSYPADGYRSATPFMPMTANSTTQISVEVIACDYVWLAILFATSGLLLAVAVAGVVLSLGCYAPDITGFVSSMTYYNLYTELPDGGGALSATERSRLLKDVKIRIGDAQGQDDIGRVVFGIAHGRNDIGKLNNRKTYL